MLTLISLGAFVLGLVLGALNFGRWAGTLLVGFLGGLSVGVRVVLLRPGLLVPNYVVNWLVLVPFMLVGIFVVLVRQRVGIVSTARAFEVGRWPIDGWLMLGYVCRSYAALPWARSLSRSASTLSSRSRPAGASPSGSCSTAITRISSYVLPSLPVVSFLTF